MSCSLAKLPNESAAFIGYVHIAEAAVFGAAHADDEMLLAKRIERTARGGTANPQAFADQTRLGGTAELLIGIAVLATWSQRCIQATNAINSALIHCLDSSIG